MYMTIYEVFWPQLFGLLRHYVLKPWFALPFMIGDLHDMAGPLVQKITAASGPKLYPACRGHMDMHHPMRYENAVCSISGPLVPWDTAMSTYFWRAPLRTLPRAKIGATWGPKLFFIFRGHMDLYHPAVQKNVTFFLFGTPRPWNIAKSANMLMGTT